LNLLYQKKPQDFPAFFQSAPEITGINNFIC
jgi:hypothetical protein